MDYPQFVDDNRFIQMDASIPEIDQLRAMLNNLTRVHLLTANKFDDFDELIHAYILCGIEIFGLETGIVSHINDTGDYIVLDVISPISALEKGQVFPLEDTYCNEVFKTQKVLGFPQVGHLEYMNCHPVYQNLKLESYLSAPIFVDDKLYGTLNFTSVTPRTHGFSEHEHNLILLLANSIGNYVLLRSKEDRLIELNDKIMRFVGYVSHDLRNPIGGIIALSKLASRKLEDTNRLSEILPKITETAERALELVKKILDSAALSTGKLTLEWAAVNLNDLIQSAVISVSDFAIENHIFFDIQVDTDLMVMCDQQRIQQSITNLLINAIKFAPQGSAIDIQCTHKDDHINIKILNYMQKADTGNTPVSGLYDSIGFGLEIVNTVLKAHNTELCIKQSSDVYSAQFKLPIFSSFGN